MRGTGERQDGPSVEPANCRNLAKHCFDLGGTTELGSVTIGFWWFTIRVIQSCSRMVQFDRIPVDQVDHRTRGHSNRNDRLL